MTLTKITLALALVLAPIGLVVAATNTRPPTQLSHAQCDTLSDLWWHAEDQLNGIRTCRTTRCAQTRVDLQLYQRQLAGIWEKGGCARFLNP